MASIKLKFRPSACKGKEGTLFFQLIQGRTVRRMRSKFRIFNEEWDSAAGQIVLPQHPSPQADRLSLIRSNVELELRVLEDIVADLDLDGDAWDADEAVERFMMSRRIDGSVFHFMENQIQRKLKLGWLRSAETYQTTLNSFMGFRKGVDLTFSMIDSAMMQLYEAAMRSRGLSRNTTSFYMRIMRTNYRMAVEEGLTDDKRPFRHVYCGIDKTVKRSITFADIKRIKDLDLSQRPVMAFARDMFIFSFCTRGMSFVDMAYLRKADLKNGYLTYRRKKTGQLLTIEWTRQMQEVMDKCSTCATQYLLPIIVREDGSERRQYQNMMLKVNRNLKKVAAMAGLSVPLTLYYSRHSWATIARYNAVPLSVISEGLGHDSEATTQIYLDSIQSCEVDKANRKILRNL